MKKLDEAINIWLQTASSEKGIRFHEGYTGKHQVLIWNRFRGIWPTYMVQIKPIGSCKYPWKKRKKKEKWLCIEPFWLNWFKDGRLHFTTFDLLSFHLCSGGHWLPESHTGIERSNLIHHPSFSKLQGCQNLVYWKASTIALLPTLTGAETCCCFQASGSLGHCCIVTNQMKCSPPAKMNVT
jgi:hypothetical protein